MHGSRNLLLIAKVEMKIGNLKKSMQLYVDWNFKSKWFIKTKAVFSDTD